MRYVLWKNHIPLIRNFIFFIMGIYTGMFIYLYFHGNQIDDLIKKNEQLSLNLEYCTNEKETLEKENKEKSHQLIRSVKFNFLEDLDSYDETELLKALVEETHFLIGKKVEDVASSPEFIYQLLNGKIFKAKEKNYELKVKIIYINSNTEIWVSAKLQKM